MMAARNRADEDWGGQGLVDPDGGHGFQTMPDDFFDYADARGLWPADQMFILRAKNLQRQHTVPYADQLGLDPKTVTKVKKRLIAWALMKDETSRKGKLMRPWYNFEPLYKDFAQWRAERRNQLAQGEPPDQEEEAA